MYEKIVVTGASGFIGKALTLKLLQEGKFVYAVVRDISKISELQNVPNIKIIQLDMEHYKNLPQLIDNSIDVFFHLAWNGYGTETNNINVQFANVTHSIDSFKVAEKMNAKKFVFTGTSHEFLKTNINGEFKLCSIYGLAKATFKSTAAILSQSSKMLFNSTIFSHVFGEYDYNKRSSYHIIKNMLNNKAPLLASKNMLYDWIYVEDAINGLLHVAESGINMKDYYIGSLMPRKFSEIIYEIRDVLHYDGKLKFGEYNDNTFIDYNMIDMNALNNDTDFITTNEFKESIYKTACWIKNNNI